MFGMGPWELALIFLVILLLFGAKRLPDIAQGLGKGIREFKSALKDTQSEIKSGTKEADKKENNSGEKKDG
ncbi:MAG: twin-arginine translocase TatA/TatE family subunit [candidate division Zixibacteria bacterium HGW-Zixibacteria-1]|nr:MAG: twin-arginine translocase TatA/TatE family subunit [candidate division Zixibacteria bacterium HGW-Zixibacteria-1]